MKAFILCSLIVLSQQRWRLKTTCVNSRISALIIGWMQHNRTVFSFPDRIFLVSHVRGMPTLGSLRSQTSYRAFILPSFLQATLTSGLPIGVFCFSRCADSPRGAVY